MSEAPPRSLARGLTTASRWTAKSLVLVVGLVVLWLLLRTLWAVVFPLLLALLLSSLLWPLCRGLHRAMPRALAALLSLLVLLAVVAGVIWAAIPALGSGTRRLGALAQENLTSFTTQLRDLPLDLSGVDLQQNLEDILGWVGGRWQDILFGIASGLGSVTSLIVVLLLTLVLTFFCLKDGERFLPWVFHWTSPETHVHAGRLGEQAWQALSAYLKTQIIVALVDAVFIGLGLWLLDVPLAFPLALLIFFAGFIPVIGAVSTGLLATLVALLAHGWATALATLVVVLAVQQLEANLLQPYIVGKALHLHPAVVIGAVTLGFTLFGIIGAFLAVPVTAVAVVVLRYLREQTQPAPPPEAPETPSDAADEDPASPTPA
ncbi:MAG: AI-2E family transporter [Arthrobacter sp.]|uniref:Putative integral membrane protein n=1 Tax=Arthrobacter rhombi TaxID=71253 RepID=A0A1R4GVH8_9MICC|nr:MULTISPECIES: AI-2E family transporter [Micrococcaceae]MDN5813347.1 AI-2E family transporter [Micrococcaceae bacterium]MDN5880184.1 AI-2E family transporter [Micrococcaceae bacterium]MDN5886927.1 AI-2E family transporter [Micrococcaceae bacterium]PCC24117.1 AI-2E family transporter [Glutamicibacter sp. BW78]SJM72053.1 putative integral membrane protein [Arthrobacter rhombi]